MSQVEKSFEKLNSVLDQLDSALDVKAKALSESQLDLFGGTPSNSNEQGVDPEQLALVTACLDKTIERVETLLKEGA